MEEIIIIVEDPLKVNYAVKQACHLTEKLQGQKVKVTLCAEGNEASKGLLEEQVGILMIKASGGEVFACVHEIDEEESLRKVCSVLHGCLTDIERRVNEGAEIMRI